MPLLTFTLFRLPLLALAGGLITLLLFYLMQHLIRGEDTLTRPDPAPRIADITMPDLDITVIREQPLPPKPEDPVEAPELDFPVTLVTGPGAPFSFEKPVVAAPETTGPAIGMTDTNAVPLVQVAPAYPQRAQQRGIEGYVVLEFDVDERGQVVNPRVLYAEPEGYFETAALRALERYRYQPKVQDGKEVRMFGVQQKMTFTLQ